MEDQERFEIEITTDYKVSYTTKEPVPISEIIGTLKSLESLIKRSRPLIEAKYKQIEVLDIKVYVQRLEAGSLKESFIINLICGSKENADEAKRLLEKMMKDSRPLGIVIAFAVGAMASYGLTKCSPDAVHTTEFYNNTIINVGAALDLDVGDVQMILDSVTDKKTLARESVDFVRPAKRDPDATIESDAAPQVTVPSEVIAEAPDVYEPPQQREKETQYSDVSIVIYASDRDKTHQVWAGIVPGIADKRVRFVLDDEIDPAKLHGHTRMQADITLIQRFNKKTKSFEPREVLIRAVAW